MRRRWHVKMAVGAIAVLTCNVADKEPHAMGAQVVKSWSDVGTPAAWNETMVDLLVPGSGNKTSAVERIRAKSITFASSIPPRLFSAIVVPDPHTGKTSILPGGRFFISDSSGMTAVSFVLGVVNLKRSLLEVTTTANADEAAIHAFVGRFSEKQLADETERYSTVRLAESAPPGFFLNGSQLVPAELKAFDLADGVLRLDLRSQNGTTGSFWIELSSLRVVKTQFSR